MICKTGSDAGLNKKRALESHEPFEALDSLFRPRSVAVVGVSPREPNRNRFFLDSMKGLGFRGPLYAINATGEQVGEYPTYRRLIEIEGPVDHAILAVPAASMMTVLEDCSAKGVRSVAIFSSGFSESREPRGKLLEKDLRAWMKEQSFRLIGPNCMGIYCPETGLGFRKDFPQEGGSIGFVSQSGGMTITGVMLGASKGLRFSKVISYGNEADLGSIELLRYLARDPRTSLVWAYLEGTPNGPELIKAMAEVVREKPLLVLKGGTTNSGNRAVASHTGAMAGSSEVWTGALRKAGAITVNSLEELTDASLALLHLPPSGGRRLGLLSISGGLSVNYTDQAIRSGFQIPPLSPGLVAKMREQIDRPGTSLNNPLDLAGGFFYYHSYPKIFGSLDRSGEIDVLVLVLALEYIIPHEHGMPDLMKVLVNAFLDSVQAVKCPFLVVMPQVVEEEKRREIERVFMDKGIPVFTSMESALRALCHWQGYWTRVGGGQDLDLIAAHGE